MTDVGGRLHGHRAARYCSQVHLSRVNLLACCSSRLCVNLPPMCVTHMVQGLLHKRPAVKVLHADMQQPQLAALGGCLIGSGCLPCPVAYR